MEVDVINNADKSVKQQPDDHYRGTLLKGGELWGIDSDIHVGTGAVAKSVLARIYTWGELA